MLENLREAFDGIWSHKLRSVLTMLGIIIGIASIIAISSTIMGTNEQIKQNLIGAGNNNVNVTLKQGDYDFYMDYQTPEGVIPVTEEMIEEIRAFDDVEDASFYYTRAWVDSVRNGKNSLGGGKMRGIDSHYFNTCGYVIYRGRAFADVDYEKNHKVALLEEIAATALFPEGGAVGSVIDIQNEPFTVIGLFKRSEEFQPVINSLQDYYTYNQTESGTVLVPDAIWPVIYRYDEPKMCVARAARVEDMSNVGKEVADVMSRCVTGNNEELSYKAEDLLEKARNQQELSASTNNLLIWIASIALLVGGIGVMNIMLVSVTERTAEIGLKKALGARKSRILGQFLTESVMLTSLGGILGVAAGIVLAYVISHMSGTPVAISVPAILLGVGFSMVIGIIFGILPSVKAANLNPIEALRHE